MLQRMRYCLAIVFFVAVIAGTARGRHVAPWPYDRLLRESDVVVIASVRAVEDDKAGGQSRFNGVAVVRRVTTFDVRMKVKGDIGDTLVVIHLRRADGQAIADGPLLVDFRKHGPVVRPVDRGDQAVVALGDPDYLLCLKRGADGTYEPVTGQYDAQLSVREMYLPLP